MDCGRCSEISPPDPPVREPFVHGFLFPHMAALTEGLVDVVGAGRFDALQNFAQGPEHRFAVLVLCFDLRFKQQMHMVWHHARGIELVLAVFVRVKNALEDEVPFRRREFAALAGGKRDHVFGPGALKMREIAAGVLGAGCTRSRRAVARVGPDREGAVGNTRGRVFSPGHGIRERAAIFLAAQFFQRVENGAEDVRFVVGNLRIGEIRKSFGALNDAGHALKAHAGIHVLGRSGENVPSGLALN